MMPVLANVCVCSYKFWTVDITTVTQLCAYGLWLRSGQVNLLTFFFKGIFRIIPLFLQEHWWRHKRYNVSCPGGTVTIFTARTGLLKITCTYTFFLAENALYVRVCVCTVWGWQASLHHHSELLRDRSQRCRQECAVSILWQTLPWRAAAAGQGRGPWAG